MITSTIFGLTRGIFGSFPIEFAKLELVQYCDFGPFSAILIKINDTLPTIPSVLIFLFTNWPSRKTPTTAKNYSNGAEHLGKRSTHIFLAGSKIIMSGFKRKYSLFRYYFRHKNLTTQFSNLEKLPNERQFSEFSGPRPNMTIYQTCCAFELLRW